MVVVKKQKGETDDHLINRFRNVSKDIIQEARDRQRHKTDSEKRKERKQRLAHLDDLKRKRNN
jgi:hypothetical protein